MNKHEEAFNFLKKNRRKVGRYDPTRRTPVDQRRETLLSDPVPESEWHEDDKPYILESLNALPGELSVKRRPDGTLCVMSNLNKLP